MVEENGNKKRVVWGTPLENLELDDVFSGLNHNDVDYSKNPEIILISPSSPPPNVSVAWDVIPLVRVRSVFSGQTTYQAGVYTSDLILQPNTTLQFRVTYQLKRPLDQIIKDNGVNAVCDKFSIKGRYKRGATNTGPKEQINSNKLPGLSVCIGPDGKVMQGITTPRKVIDCATEHPLPSSALRDIFMEAGKTFNVPPAVLAGVAAIEGQWVFRYDDDQIRVMARPYPGASQYVAAQGVYIGWSNENCGANACSARGTMQFTTGGENKNSKGVCWPDKPDNTALPNQWKIYACSVMDPRIKTDPASGLFKLTNRYGSCDPDNPDSTPNICNIVDSIFAAAHKLGDGARNPQTKDAKGIPVWTNDEIREAVIAYYGSQFTSREGYPDYYQCVSDYNRAHPDLTK
ncbi:MAG: hypothetical protein Q8N98_04435 [bacterium]|nr:hypothetical protein [bacterium]